MGALPHWISHRPSHGALGGPVPPARQTHPDKESGMRTSGRTRRTAVIAVAGLAACATLITGCMSSSKDSSGRDGRKSFARAKSTLDIGDFGSCGYDDKTGAKLFAEYHTLHPNITVVEDNVSDSGAYWNSLK